jgi:signal transduction histidine kinase
VRDEEQHLRRPDSPTQILSVSAFPLPSDPGQKRRAMVVVRDVTLERSYQDSLANFAGTVAHDLNNPLSVIDGWAEAIQEDLAESADPMAKGAASAVDHIRGGVEQMRSFISDLLAHAVARDQTLRCEAVALRNVVKHIAAQRDRSELPNGGIKLGELPDVWADRLLVRQVLDNLISNALKYVDAGVTPDVRVEAAAVGDGWVQVTVCDNGIGIDPGQRERIFDSFHRASRDGYSGTGLGLAICKRIIERHGGTIRVEGNPGGGSVFVFTLPATPAAFAAATQS